MSKKANWFKGTPAGAKDNTTTYKPPMWRRKSQMERKEPPPTQDNRPVEVVVFISHTNNSSLKNLLHLTDDTVSKPLNAGRTR